MKTFTYIEDRISTLLEAHGDLLPAAGDDEADETVTVDGGTVLDGPQMEGGGVSQDDVDAMFVGDDDEGEAKKEGDKKTSQDDIDALFD